LDSKRIPASLSLSDKATLNLLGAIESGEHVTQRSLAAQLGVALGMTNGLISRCVRKGLIKVREVPARRYAYYLTPKGFGEKSRLVSEYLTSSLTFFRQAREEFNAIFEDSKKRSFKRIALYGTGELAEIALLSGNATGVKPVCVIQPDSNLTHMSGIEVVCGVGDGGELDAIILTASDTPQTAYDQLIGNFDSERVYLAPLLHVTAKDSCDQAEGR
jgi:DNA-binding MarR family transcriptional regulator